MSDTKSPKAYSRPALLRQIDNGVASRRFATFGRNPFVIFAEISFYKCATKLSDQH